MMDIRIREHYPAVGDNAYRDSIKDELKALMNRDGFKPANETICFKNKKGKDHVCFKMSVDGGTLFVQSSYFIGIDRLPTSQAIVCVEPKLNGGTKQLDFLQMLIDALKDAVNLEHLEGLLDVRPDEPWIEDVHRSSNLTAFVVLQFLAILKGIVRKGLKKGYFEVADNLNSRIKGKILISDQIKRNVFRNKGSYISCKYQKHGFDIGANQFLKYVLSRAVALLGELPAIYSQVKDDVHFLSGAFDLVSNMEFKKWTEKECNPFYNNYNDAFGLGNLIVKLSGNDLNGTVNENRKFPPHWINMSKLFELYVFKKLRKANQSVTYQLKVHRQIPDFLVKSKWGYSIVDAKYKPRYQNGNPSMEDARQLAGYARLNGIFKHFNLTEEARAELPVIFIYPKNISIEFLEKEEQESFEIDRFSHCRVLEGELRESTAYFKMFLQEIELPFVDCC